MLKLEGSGGEAKRTKVTIPSDVYHAEGNWFEAVTAVKDAQPDLVNRIYFACMTVPCS